MTPQAHVVQIIRRVLQTVCRHRVTHAPQHDAKCRECERLALKIARALGDELK